MRLLYSIPVLALAVLTGCGEKSRRPEQEKTGPPTPVTALSISASDWPAVYEAVGTVRARVSAAISAKVMGYVHEVRVQAGDRVTAGQLLVSIDSRDLDAQTQAAGAALNEARSALPEAENAVAAAKANLDLAQVTFGRMQDLYRKKSISDQEFDEATAKLKMAQAGYEMALSKRSQVQARIHQAEAGQASAQVMRSYAEIKAPFAGVVTEKRVNAGDLTAPGAPLLTIEQESSYRLEVNVEESRIGSIRTGTPVTVALDALDRSLDAQVSEVVPAVDAASRAFVVKINLPPLAQLRSGLFGRAQFRLGTRPVLAVPAGAVRESGQVQTVLVVADGVARARLVTLGQRSGEQVEVLSGLNAGDRVIHPLPAGLSDGARVEVRP
jgi:RND family efflux transporter MFP subunit